MTTHLLKDYTDPFLEQNPVCSICVYSAGYDLIIGNYFIKNILKSRNYTDTDNDKAIIKNIIAPKFTNKFPVIKCVNVFRDFKEYTYNDNSSRNPERGYYNYIDGIYISNHRKHNDLYNNRFRTYLLHLPVMETLDEVVNEIYYAVSHPREFTENNIIKLRVNAVIGLYRHVYDKLVDMMVKTDSEYIVYDRVYKLLKDKFLLHIDMCNIQDNKWSANLEALLIDDENYNIALDAAKIIKYNMPIK